VLSQTTQPGVVSERLPIPPAVSAPEPGAKPYRLRPRAELAKLLHSTSSSASGLPEAVLARLVLGESATMSLTGEPTLPDVAARLLSGALPVHPDDLPFLARALGVGSDPRVARMRERLHAAPDAAKLPRAPAFHRVRRGRAVEGWTLEGRERVRYDVSVATLLGRADVPRDVRVIGDEPTSPTGVSADVPDVEALSLWMPERAGDVLRLRALRVALWIAVGASMVCLLAMRRALAAEARATAREKRFLASVTHELRTPLAAMRLFGETLAEGRGDPREYGALVAQESERLSDLVERVLAATRVDEAPRFGPVSPGELARSAVGFIAARAERRHVSVECHAEHDLPEVRWDADAVHRALLNLIDNAVKHGREGGHIDVRVSTANDHVSLSVADDGPGIGPAYRDGIFRRFTRGPTDAPGTGLGLYLVEQVARAHGGRVDLVTKESHGSIFTLVLPVVPPGAEAGA